MTLPSLAFIDTETTSLRPDRRVWEVALIYYRPTTHAAPRYVQTRTMGAFIAVADLDLGNADSKGLAIGGFYDRHPEMNGGGAPAGEREVLTRVEFLTRGAVLLGSNPAFDIDVLGARMRANGIAPSWHYHPEDVPTLALGWLYGRGLAEGVPRKSDAISLACGIDPAKYARHTAFGDCEWMRDLYARVCGWSAPDEATA